MPNMLATPLFWWYSFLATVMCLAPCYVYLVCVGLGGTGQLLKGHGCKIRLLVWTGVSAIPPGHMGHASVSKQLANFLCAFSC
jgi:hypothetical protein